MASKQANQPPTMNDVAELAGVSQATVSYVVNDAPNVSITEATRNKVWDAIEELGYRPNTLAQGLRTKRSGQIGFITDLIATTPHAGQIVKAAQEVAWSNNKVLLLVNTEGNPDIRDTAIEMMLGRRVEGIIYATMYHRAVNPPEAAHQVPTVLLNCYTADRSLPSVVPDEVDAAYSAVDILIEKGHRRVGFINSRSEIPATVGRLQGYREALADHGIRFDQDLVQSCNVAFAQNAYHCALDLMKVPEPPTAIFCFSDLLALGVYEALRKLNLAIPDDVAVMGFDNHEMIAAQLQPTLSTMQLPHFEMGVWAVNHLLKHMDDWDRQGTPLQHKIHCSFIERESL